MNKEDMMKIMSVCVLGAALGLLGSCQQATTGAAESRAVQSTALWEPLVSFNSSVWNEANWTNGGMFNCGFVPANISFSPNPGVAGDGLMTITLNNTPSFGKPYSSGEYRTNNTFTYGTFETNMKPAKATGTDSSFFLYTGSPWDEIDIEFLGKDTTSVQFNYFVSGVGGHEKVVSLGFDASQSFHKYAIEYGNGYINWYVDGVWKWGVNNTGLNAPAGAAMPSHPMQIMANLWPGTGVDSWLGAFTYTGPLYATYDYFKYTPK
jgi:beta-glucanase (GH16 family)